MTTWFDNPHRPTRDLDLLGFGESSAESIVAAFRDICGIEQNDGVTFDAAALRVTVIREGATIFEPFGLTISVSPSPSASL